MEITTYLTRQEKKVATLVSLGLRNQAIAGCLNIQYKTLAEYLTNIYSKLYVKNRVELAVYWTKNGKCDNSFSNLVITVDIPLTEREKEVAALVFEGLTNKHIASKLFISKRTVDDIIYKTLKKLGIKSKVELAIYYLQNFC